MEQELILTGRNIVGLVLGGLFIAIAAGFAVWWRMSSRLNQLEGIARQTVDRYRIDLAQEKGKVPELEKDRKVRGELNSIIREHGRAGFRWVSGTFVNSEPFTYLFRGEEEHGDLVKLVTLLLPDRAVFTGQGHVYLDENGHAPQYLWGPILLQSCGFVPPAEWIPEIPGTMLNAMLPPEIRGVASTLLASDRTRMGAPLQRIPLPPLNRAAGNNGT